jgi:hypothetical protein
MPKPDRTRNRNNWLLLAILLAVAVVLYGAIVMKVVKFGFGET